MHKDLRLLQGLGDEETKRGLEELRLSRAHRTLQMPTAKPFRHEHELAPQRRLVLLLPQRQHRARHLVLERRRALALQVAVPLAQRHRDGGRVGQGILGAARVALGPDLVVLDLGLPGLDGLEVLRSIRSASNGSRLPT